jgi:hypothetical protein
MNSWHPEPKNPAANATVQFFRGGALADPMNFRSIWNQRPDKCGHLYLGPNCQKPKK